MLVVASSAAVTSTTTGAVAATSSSPQSRQLIISGGSTVSVIERLCRRMTECSSRSNWQLLHYSFTIVFVGDRLIIRFAGLVVGSSCLSSSQPALNDLDIYNGATTTHSHNQKIIIHDARSMYPRTCLVIAACAPAPVL